MWKSESEVLKYCERAKSSKDLGSKTARHNRWVMSTGRGTGHWKSVLNVLPQVFLFLNNYVNVLRLRVLINHLSHS